ncbi:MAG: DUF559 domain-containing protein [Clostridia bacterium]|nr:DUF559 domain-containing protein [Clostridia bacterium]
MTPEEKHLWYDLLKKLPCNVRRQHNIENYIVDFYIASKKVVIEVDGSQHASPDNKAYDQKRTEELSKWGIKVLRYKNIEINTAFDVVCTNILNNLGIKYEELKK